jgi:hypothetical protein
VRTFDGETFSFPGPQGSRALLIHFLTSTDLNATFIGPLRDLAETAKQRYSGKGLRVLTVSLDRGGTDSIGFSYFRKLIDGGAVTAPVFFDGLDFGTPLARLFAVRTWGTTVLVDEQTGKIIDIRSSDAAGLEAKLSTLLGP